MSKVKIKNIIIIFGLIILESCSLFGHKLVGRKIKPRKKIVFNGMWECPEDFNTRNEGPYIIFKKGFQNNHVQIIVNDSLYLDRELITNKSTGTAGSVNIGKLLFHDEIILVIDSKTIFIKWNPKYCYLEISNFFGIAISMSKKRNVYM